MLSDERLISSLIEAGKHDSLRRLEHNSTVASATLAGAATRPAHEVLESAALKLLAGQADPLVRLRAVGCVRNQDVLERVLVEDPDPVVRIEAISQLTLWAQEVTPGRPARQSVRDAVTKDPAPTVRLHALRRVDTDEDIAWDERETLVFDAALLDPDEHVRLKALELLETDRALLDVATDTVVDPGTSRAARDLVFARIAAGSVPRRRVGMVERRTDGGMRVPAHTSKLGRNRPVEHLAMDVARSNNREMLERLVDTLGSSSFSGSWEAGEALKAMQAVLDNPVTTDELYAKASTRSEELAKARDAAILREKKDLEKHEQEKLFTRSLSAYTDLRDDITVGLRHARAGKQDKAVGFLSGKALYAAAAGLSDARDIRDLWECMHGKVKARDLKEVSELLRRNPSTPADMLPLIDTALRRLTIDSHSAPWHGGRTIADNPTSTSEDIAFVLTLASQNASAGRFLGWHHVLPVLMKHPNATQEQRDTATKLLNDYND